MNEYKRIPTSHEVWAVIKARHGDSLKVFSGYSSPDGSDLYPRKGVMETSYGFPGCDYPIIEARTEWDIPAVYEDRSYERKNERHEFWLCVGIEEDNT